MKKILILILPLILLHGCSPSLIRLYTDSGKVLSPVSARQPSGNYYIPAAVSDSIKELWDRELHGGLTNTSAAVFNEYVLLSDLSGWITCLDIKNGKVKGVLKNKGGTFASPIMHKSVLIYPVTEYNEDYSLLYYYDIVKGAEVSKVKIQGKITGEIADAGKSIFFVTENGTVYNYDLNGNKIWQYDTDAKIYNSPAIGSGIVVLGNSRGEVITLSENKGRVLLRTKISRGFYGNPSVSGDTVYIGDSIGNLYAVNLKTGKIIWRRQTGTKILCAPVFTEDEIYAVNLGGVIFSFNKTSGTPRWRINVGGLLNATPLLTKNFLIVPDLDGKLYFVNILTGRVDKTIETQGRSKLSPVIINNKLIIGYDYNKIAAYEIIK